MSVKILEFSEVKLCVAWRMQQGKIYLHLFSELGYPFVDTEFGTNSILSIAIVGKHDNGWCKIDDYLFWNEVLLKDANCSIFLENHRIRDLEELAVRYIQWDIDIKLKEKNWEKDNKHN